MSVTLKLKKNTTSIVLIILFYLFPTNNLAQNYSDAQIEIIMIKFNKLLLSADFTDALELIKKEEIQIVSQKGDALARINYLYSKYYLFIENYDQAKVYAEKSLITGEKSRNNIDNAFGHYAMANYYYQFNMLALAYKFLNLSLELIEPSSHPYLLYHIHYRLYSINTNWDSAIETNIHAQKALDFALQTKDYDALSNAYSAKVHAMKYMHEKTKNLVYKDSILIYLKESVNLDQKHPNQVSLRTNAISNINLADYYFQAFNTNQISYKTAYDTISKYLNKVENIPSSIDQNFELRASSLGMKAQLALAKKDFKTAEKHLLNAYYNLRMENSRPAYYTLYNVTIGLHTLYNSQQDYKSAYKFLGINQSYKDSIFNENKINEVHSLKAKYENVKISEENKFLENKNKLQKKQNYLLIAVSFFALSTLVFFYKNHRKKMALQKNNSVVLEKQNEKAIAQVILAQEKQARLTAERRILKLENEQMQKEAIVNILQIDRKNELLEIIRKELASSYPYENLQKTLKKEQKIEKSLNETVKVFEDINPVFFDKLKEQSQNCLTALDLKYCAYFHLGLSAKEISQVFNVEPKSIRMTKYRIKQKLNLAKGTTLESFFEEI